MRVLQQRIVVVEAESSLNLMIKETKINNNIITNNKTNIIQISSMNIFIRNLQ
jgi:hypothetical protein